METMYNLMVANPLRLISLLLCILMIQSYPQFSASTANVPWSFTLNASDLAQQYCSKELSGNATRLCFVSTTGSKPPSFTLSLLISPLSFSYQNPQPIWTANRNHPVSDGATVMLGQDGNLALYEANGTLIWSSNTLHKGVSRIQIEPPNDDDSDYPYDLGCLALYNSSNSSVWRSYDHPTDTIMENQPLSAGQKLVSNLSSSDASEGPYSLVLEPGGLALYFDTGLGQLLPYWTWGVYGLNDVYSVSHTCKHPFAAIFRHSRIIFGADQFKDSNTTSSQLCDITSSDYYVDYFNPEEIISPASTTVNLNFLRIETDGALRSYSWAGNGWLLEYDPLADQCLLPNRCGPYSICTSPSSCTCPQNVTSEGLGFPQDSNGSGCVPGTPLSLPASCNLSNSSSNIIFLELTGVEYVSSRYLAPDLASVPLGDCKEACLGNCSCKALFYHNETRSCYFALHQLWTMHNTTNQSHAAFIKVVKIPSSSHRSRSIVVSVSVSLAVGVLLVAALLIYYMKRTRGVLADDEAALRGEERDLDEVHFTRFRFKVLEDATSGFTSRRLGHGGSGEVFEGLLPGRGIVAIKRLKDGDAKSFRAEVETLGRVNHVNLVRLEGFCAEESHRLLVYEYIPNGSLSSWIFDPQADKVLSWFTRFQIARDTADCFAYLHEKCRERILHLDIKPQNILLDGQLRAKVSDFGLAKLLHRSGDADQVTLAGAGGTIGYIAPELFATNHVATTKADVYSFGIVLWELVSGRRVVDHQGSYSFGPVAVFPKVESEAWDEVIDPSVYKDVEHSEKGLLQVKNVLRLAYWCIQKDPLERPEMKWVLEQLQSEIEVPGPPLTPTFAPELAGFLAKLDGSILPQPDSLSCPR